MACLKDPMPILINTPPPRPVTPTLREHRSGTPRAAD
eukprot:CAMPEP_0179023554 /NCGR_PEP_ID=MMETSP0796-20121207/6991_1 /TAXON_ID=73915 /ORGANISM="Pyrodinium bahamense, Strain pbaha01" /LENGTH=36 /DNA_ID= /DNA_START= /DNA_END= /DNA_ORIENTATION=